MKKVILHGYLAELHPDPIVVHATSAAEAIASLQLIPAFDPKKGKQHTVMVTGFDSKDALYDHTSVEEIHLHPVMAGSGGKFGRIIIGAILVVVGAILTYFGFGNIGVPMMQMGASMVIGGIINLLMNQKQPDSTNDQMKSQYIPANRNTVNIGTRIPMIYGRAKAYGHFLSFDVDSRDMSSSPEPWYCSVYDPTGEFVGCVIPNSGPGNPQSGGIYSANVYEGMIEGGMGTLAFVQFSPETYFKKGVYDVTIKEGTRTYKFQVVCEADGIYSQLQTLMITNLNGFTPATANLVFNFRGAF